MCILYFEEDFWKQYAAEMFKVPYVEVTAEQRKEAKMSYYRMAYGGYALGWPR